MLGISSAQTAPRPGVADRVGAGHWLAFLAETDLDSAQDCASRSPSPKVITVGNTNQDINQLVTAVAETRDRESFQALFNHFAPRVKAVLVRQGADSGTAEEVVQETMIKVWRKANLFDAAKASASTWIYQIARNSRIDLIRRARRPEPDMNDPSLVPDPDPSIDEVISRGRDARQLKEVFDRLPGEQQDVLKLAFFEEKAHSEIADQLGIPLGTVKSRIRLALKRIRSEFGT